MDYTPGAFDNATSDTFKQRGKGPMVMSTRAQQLAMYVVYESPLQMLCDSPGVYRGQPGLDFLTTVPTTWDETRGLDGQIGEFVAVARRSGNRWFLGAMTNESSRTLTLPMNFLGQGTYRMTSYADGPAATENRKDLTTATKELAPGQPLQLNLAPWGGFAAVLEPK
jgi:alpha-glucosidase